MRAQLCWLVACATLVRGKPARADAGTILDSSMFKEVLLPPPPPPPPPLASEGVGPGVHVMPAEAEPQESRTIDALRSIGGKQWPWMMLGLSTVMLAFVLGSPSEEDDQCLIV
jgi:hypothetical protein